MHYQHLTAADRGIIEGMLRANCTPSDIAKELGVDPTTVSREIKQRSTPKGYSAKVAQLDYQAKRLHCGKPQKLKANKRQKYVTTRLQLGWSPEQIAGRLKLLGRDDLYVCPETIYHWLYSDPWAHDQEKLYHYLRLGRKKRKPKVGRNTKRAKIPNRVSIHERPEAVSQRVEYGHAEGDSVIYPYKQAINTVNELMVGRVGFTKLDRKTAELTAKAMKEKAVKLNLKTYTVDNGSEHTNHKDYGIPTYFCDPYCSSQRGANENVNMLLRGYLPKRTNIQDLTQEELDDIAEELNNRPRKRLGFRTPNEAYQLLVKSKERKQAALGSRM
jgi:transposase, IS30 family